jgi:hypothetical protein
MSIEKKPAHSKAMKIVLFWSNWILVLFIGKRFFGSPRGELDFWLKNLGTFAVATIATAVMLHFLQGKVIKITIVAIWIVILLAAVM